MLEVATGVLTPDESLVNLARRGDRRACEELLFRYRNVAYVVAYRQLGHEQDAQDAVQDGFLKAVTHLQEFDGRSGFKTWLLRIVTNAAYDLGRRRGRRPTLPLADGETQGIEPACDDDPAAGLHQEDLRQTLEAALGRLSPAIRETFVLFVEGGLSYKEIAEMQAIPIGTVMSRLHYARDKLQAFLKLDGIEGI
jgi:RNA polymerase sigma-70 factor, ECF subfamily